MKDVFKIQTRSLEKLPIRIWEVPLDGSINVARSIALAIRQKQQDGEQIVLGLATGSSPIKVYNELVRMHKEEGLSFKNVVTFNLDEYYPMQPDAEQSYVRFMHEYLFDHIDIPKKNIHIPDGTIPVEEVEEYCREYERKIDAFGGLDIQVLGIGRTGHIGFNEPGSREESLTRMVKLDGLTRRDATKDFADEEDVPYRAITMGVGSIMKARVVYLLAWGMHKAPIIRKAIEGPITSAIPSTFLQKHKQVKIVLDKAATTELTQFKTPWVVGLCNWTEDLICKAVIWLSLKVGKSILKLTEEDYNENDLSDLIVEYDSGYSINLMVFNRLQRTITGWPGGKPNADDSNRPERSKPAKKRVLIFSPHPDDDVISMGGTFIRLVEQGHEVHVAYQTSGNIAVHDHHALLFIEFAQEFHKKMGVESEGAMAHYEEAKQFILQKKADQSDDDIVRMIKGLIRREEARSGARLCGALDANIHFLDMPFYETGRSRKAPVGPKDVSLIVDLMQKIKPHQVYSAGDLADPHGTHRVCLDATFQAFEQLKSEKWMEDCWLWLYRGAWHEWSVEEIEMAVPLSPTELMRKRKAIFRHQSQKDRAPFPGEDPREFWQRAEDRNRETAGIYNALGLADYEAMEAFVRWKF